MPALFALALLLALAGPQPALAQEHAVDFEREIVPILERSCLKCHGPDQQMAGLRLDVREQVLGDATDPKLVSPGQAEQSELFRLVAGLTDKARMPMGDELPADEIEQIRRWIAAGAKWPEGVRLGASDSTRHWAFVAPRRPALPEVRGAEWAANAIDRFVLARLEKEGLSPSPEADRATLLRRLSLDLIGLPPTIEEVDAFLADTSADAYGSQVNRLLQSPHYGERWGRLWLDAARYADSDGFEKDKPRQVWFYRDWVVGALNDDMPYDRFIIEQIAGDLLPNATQEQIVATGFLRNSMINEEGGIDPEQFRMEAMYDRMDAIGKGILGLTIQCSQCHNHKYDPLTQEEYYRLFAFLNNSHEAKVAVYTPDEQSKRRDIFGRIRKIEDGLQRQTPDWQRRMAAWEDEVRDDQPEWTVVRPRVEDISTGGQKYIPQPDGSLLAQGYAPTFHTVKMEAATDVHNITAFRLELLTDANLPLGGPGRSKYGAGALTEFTVRAAPLNDPEAKRHIWFSHATADVNPPERELDPADFPHKEGIHRFTGPISYAIDGCDETAWTFDVGAGRSNQPRKAVFVADKPVTDPDGTVLTFSLRQRHGGSDSNNDLTNNLGRVRLSVTTAPNPVADPLPAEVREIVSIPRRERSEPQQRAVFSYWRTTVPEWKEASASIDKLWEEHPAGSTQLVMSERDSARKTHVLERGDFLQPKDEVAPGAPGFLHPLPEGAEANRLGFARWLVDPRSPTTARSIVNRVWQAYFGTGLVSTSENLGTQSETPSHPRLLDWLAVELMDNDWSMKQLHRLIVTSQTYRQSSRVTPALIEKDPANRLFARGPRFRVEAETVRDIALAAGGLLNPEVGGPPVYAPAPDFLFKPPASYSEKEWNTATGPDRYRRALYTFRYRAVPYPVLDTFDAPNGNASVVRRTRSNTPLQALTTLNETLFLEAARALALETLLAGGVSDAERVVYAFRRCLTRKPNEAEVTELLALLNGQRGRFTSGELNPWDLAANDRKKPPALPEGSQPADAAAWTAVSRVLLNLDETVTKQ